MKEKRWLTPTELEVEYSISTSTQAKMRAKRQIPFSKIGSKYIRYDRKLVDKWLESHNIVEI